VSNRNRWGSSWMLLAPVAGILTACSGGGGGSTSFPGSCNSDGDCGADESCVNMVCQATRRSDGGSPAADSGPSSRPDAGPDASSCAGVECGGTCCQPGETCENGMCQGCVAAGSGQTCTATTECCQSGTTQPLGATCISNDDLCHANCATGTDCTSGCCAAVQGQSYGVCAAASACLAGTGSACSTSASCASDYCQGWCVSSCSASNAVCAGGYGTGGLMNEYGQYNWCLADTSGSDICFPGCSTNADCAPFPGTTCQATTDVTGYSTYVCSG
jgi:hypothetical protein